MIDKPDLQTLSGDPVRGGLIATPIEPPPLRGKRPDSTARRGFRRVRAGIAASDILCLLGALFLFQLLHPGTQGVISYDFLLVAALAPLAWVAVFHAFGLYGVQYLSASEEFRRIISATSVGVVLIMVGSIRWSEPLSRKWLGWTLLFALLFELLARRIWRWQLHRLKSSGRLVMRTLIVGTNDEAESLAHVLLPPVHGFAPVGYIGTAQGSPILNGVPVLGQIESLEQAVLLHGIECVLVTSTAVSAQEMYLVARVCRQLEVEMKVSANLPEILTSRLTIQHIDRVMALSVRPVRLSGTQAALKRSFDLVVASVGLVLFLPLIAAIAIAIRITSAGPVLFRQERVTKNGRVFIMYKFRTMVQDTERALEGRLIDLTKPFFKLQDDPRLTRIGRLLRPLSLDELPQLWNVLRGDMSLVGPRPLPADQVAANSGLLAPRHEVRAGLTGWWQINGRSDVEDYQEALRMDIFYIENWSLTLDLYILLKTSGVLLSRRGAR